MRRFSFTLVALLALCSVAPASATANSGSPTSFLLDHSDAMNASRLPGRFTAYSAAGYVPAAPASLSLDLDGVESAGYGLARFLITTDAEPRQQLATFALSLDGRRTLIDEVSVHLLQRFFEHRGFRTPVVVDQRETLTMAVRAAAAGGQGNIRLGSTILTAEQLAAAKAAGLTVETATPRGSRRGGIRTGEPVFLARTVTVPAGATAHQIRFTDRGLDLDVHRVLASCDTATADLACTVTLRADSGDILSQFCPAQLAQAFGEREATPPLVALAARPLVATIDNPTGANVRISLLIEASAQGSEARTGAQPS